MWVSWLFERLSAAGPVLLPILLDAAIKGTAILLLMALAMPLTRRISAAARYLAWFLAILSLLILPILSAVLPGWHVLPHWTTNNVLDAQPAAAPGRIAVAIPTPAPAPPLAPTVVPSAASSEINPSLLDNALKSMPPAPAVSAPLSPSATSAPAPSRPSWQVWVLLIWGAGSLLFLGYIALGFLSLWWLQHRSSRMTQGGWPILLRQLCIQLGIRRPVRMLSSPQRTMPMTWGLWRPRVLLPEDSAAWPVEQRRTVLLHELAHACRRDCLTQFVTQLACALHWFNPLAWFAWRQMQTEREQACDDLVLSTGTRASVYAEQLLQIATEMPAARFTTAAIAMARPSKLERRLRAILDVGRNRRALTRSAALLILLLIGAVAVPLAMVRAAGEEKARSQDFADRFVDDLARQNLSFLNQQKLDELRTRLHQFDADHLSQNLPAERRQVLLSAVSAYVKAHFKRPADTDALDQLYLTFPDKLQTFEWQLWLAAKRPLLTQEQTAQLQAQHQWIRGFIQSLSPQQGLKQANVLSEMNRHWVDPLDVLFSTPMDAAAFERFKAAMQSDSGAHELAFVVTHCVWNALNCRYPKAESFSLPFDDRLVGWGQGSGLVKLSFASNQLHVGWTREIEDVVKSRTVLDVLEPLQLQLPANLKSENDMDAWLAKQTHGHLIYKEAYGGVLAGVRQARLVELNVRNWIDADRIGNDKLRRLLRQPNQGLVSLAAAHRRYAGNPKLGDCFIGVLTGDDKLAVVRVVGFSDGPDLQIRPRPNSMATQPAAATQPATQSRTFPAHAAVQVVADLKEQHFSFLSDTTLVAVRENLQVFLISQPEPPPALAEAILKSLHQYIPRYFPHNVLAHLPADFPENPEMVYLSFADRVATLQWKLHLALIRRPLSPEETRRRADQLLWLHDYINAVPEPDILLRGRDMKPGGLRTEAISRLDARWSDPLDLTAQLLTDAQFQKLQQQLQSGGEWTKRNPHQPGDVLDPIETAARDSLISPEADDPTAPGGVRYSVKEFPFSDQVISLGGQAGLQLRSNLPFRGRPAGLIHYGGKWGNSVVDAATGLCWNYPDDATREKWFSEKHFGDVILAPADKALLAVRGARIAPLAVADWFAADRLTDSELIATLNQRGGTSASIADIPDRAQWMQAHQLKPIPPHFYVLQTAEKRLAVLRVLHQDNDHSCDIYVRTRPQIPAATWPAFAPTPQGRMQ